jgi:hypothetical protein
MARTEPAYDEANNTDNKWADYVDLFGRLIKVT